MWNIRLGQLEMLAPIKQSFLKDGRELRALVPSVPPGPSAVHTPRGHASLSVPLLECLTSCGTASAARPQISRTRGTHVPTPCAADTVSPRGSALSSGLRFWPVHGETGAHPRCSSLLLKFMNIPQPAGALQPEVISVSIYHERHPGRHSAERTAL